MSEAPSDPVEQLHATFRLRKSPEDVAELIAKVAPESLLKLVDRSIAARLRRSVKRRFGWSAMASVFKEPERGEKQLSKARELADLFLNEKLPEADDPVEFAAFLNQFNALIGRRQGNCDFRHHRLNREAREAIGLTISRRRYDKLFRLAVRLERKLATVKREDAKYRLLLISKAALAPDLTVENLAGHIPSAAFIAYYSARMKLRSEFTISGQQRPFDDLAERLLKACENDPQTQWFAIAHVFPRADVLGRLSEEQRGLLLGRWHSVLSETAEWLERAYTQTDIELHSMIVRRGNDSSTWNTFAAAWNRARDHWIALIEAMRMDPLFDSMLPGKVMRLMAADVAAWHRATGGDIHPDTKVWRALSKPWDVLRGEAYCTRLDIEKACKSAGVDPEKSGWSAPRPRTQIAEFRPTPELVHGVNVGSPYLATFLRDAGVFSGKPLKRKKSWFGRRPIDD